MMVAEKNTDSVKNMYLCHCMTFLPLIANFFRCLLYNKPKVKFMNSSNHMEHYRK